jgi:hypothetical protein
MAMFSNILVLLMKLFLLSSMWHPWWRALDYVGCCAPTLPARSATHEASSQQESYRTYILGGQQCLPSSSALCIVITSTVLPQQTLLQILRPLQDHRQDRVRRLQATAASLFFDPSNLPRFSAQAGAPSNSNGLLQAS